MLIPKLDDEPSESTSSSSRLIDPPPPFSPFSESTGSTSDRALLEMEAGPASMGIQEGHEPPPEFAPYEAEYTLTSAGDVVSHDPHLNEDGEALFRFLLSRSGTSPRLQCHIKGTHTETNYDEVYKTDAQGRRRIERRQRTDVVTGFDFYIDMTQHLKRRPVLWTVGDEQPAYRGQMYREVEVPGGKRKASWGEEKELKVWKGSSVRQTMGPWIAGLGEGSRTLGSSRSVREWADEYSASAKVLKEFEYEKVVYGWDFNALEEAIRAQIRATLYQGTPEVSFSVSGHKIYVRPNTRFSRIVSNKWCKVLLWILLIYPFIWLFKRFHPHGGGRWAVAGEAWALPRTTDLDRPKPHQQLLKGCTPSSSGGEGESEQGGTEGQWFRAWEPRIGRAVAERVRSSTPLALGTNYPAVALDGYDA